MKKTTVPLLKIIVTTTMRNKATSDKVLWKTKNKGLAISLRLGGKKDDHRRPNKQTYTVFLVAIL
jgi:hypothetical protein